MNTGNNRARTAWWPVAVAALLLAGPAAGSAAADTAGARDTTGTPAAARPALTPAKLPAGNGTLLGALQPDTHTSWAYGMNFESDGEDDRITPLLLAKDSRDGRGWHKVKLAPFDGSSRINGAAAAPAGAKGVRDAWVVGDSDDSIGGVYTEHWDGKAWHMVTAPLPKAADYGGLLSVSEVSPLDVWAAGWADIVDSTTQDPDGSTQVESHFEALVEHWDGKAWRRVAVPHAAAFTPNTILALPGGKVWAGGYSDTDQPVVRAYDGHRWTVSALPKAGLYGEVYALGAAPDGTLWAAGRTLLDEEDRGHSLVLRRSGGVWRQVAVPATGGKLTGLAVTPGGVTVAGVTAGDEGPLVMRLTGKTWKDLGVPAEDYVEGLAYSAARGLVVAGGSVPPDANDPVPVVLIGS
ncbi:hypothetical protein SAMN05216251_102169 [Actinacidiphila alni]|uniref:Uncharacterized protein n=1 Tax=Actinacidiphila alni TaxID=380248 RepID=A0A1I1YT95_9ACTN|nr:hypothetical protein [Actinacidiphila alni]SFE22699.1 hypothetical protein SAMN05216251_102169 [Actinacidiphila alni]